MKSNKEKKHNIKYAPFIIFSALFILIIIFSVKGVIKVYTLRSEQLAVRKNIAEIKKKNEKIENRIRELTYNKQYIAYIAREKLNMIRPGEIVFKFIGKKHKK
jgi:cell division protein FtsB